MQIFLGSFHIYGSLCDSRELNNVIYYIDTDEIPGFFLLLKNHIFIERSEDTGRFPFTKKTRKFRW